MTTVGEATAERRGSPASGRTEAPKIGLLSPCGWGNLGDVAIQEAVIGRLRASLPDVEISGFTLVPEDTEERYGIPAFPLAGRGSDGHAVVWREDPAPAGPLMRWAERVENRLFDVRYVGRLWSMGLEAVRTVRIEARHVGLVRRWVEELDVVIVSGGGQLNEYWGGPFGQPYSLFKWSELARRAGTPFVVAGVGVGTMRTRIGRFLLRRAVESADDVSCRDRESCEMVRTLTSGRRRPRVLPDLAFALVDPGAWPPPSAPGSPDGRRTIGVSPIAFRDPRSWPEKDEAAFRGYLERLGHVCVSALRSGERVLLFSTAGSDRPVVADLRSWLAERGWSAPDVVDAEVDTFTGLAERLGEVDVVVASRLHGVLLSHLADRPVLALSYDRKVMRHMEDMGQARYCLDIDGFTSREIDDLLPRLRSDAGARRELRRQVGACASRVREGIRELLRSHLPAAAGGP